MSGIAYPDAWPRQGLLRFSGASPEATWPYAVTYPDLCAAVGTMPAGLGGIEALLRILSSRQSGQRVGYLRTMAGQYPNFGAILWHNGFLIAPERYPESVGALFPVDPIPTPTDVLQWIVGPRGNNLRDADADTRFVLAWWHLGVPLAHLDACGNLQKPAEEVLADGIRLLLRRHTFLLWALGDDLLPLSTSADIHTFLREHLRERKAATLPNLKTDLLIRHPYVLAILARRTAFRPIPRMQAAPGHIFRSEAEKVAPILENPPTFARFCTTRRGLRPRIEQDTRLEWANLTPYPEELNAPRKARRSVHPVASILAERRQKSSRSR